jgi:hypothetical protein
MKEQISSTEKNSYTLDEVREMIENWLNRHLTELSDLVEERGERLHGKKKPREDFLEGLMKQEREEYSRHGICMYNF